MDALHTYLKNKINFMGVVYIALISYAVYFKI